MARRGVPGLVIGLVLLASACDATGERVEAGRPSKVEVEAPPATSQLAVGGPRPTSRVVVDDPGERSEVEVRVGEILSDLETSTTPEGTVITLPELVLFEFDRAELKAEAATTLADIAEVLTFYEGAPVSIRGHTDDFGDAAYNDDLSQHRAQAVADALVEGHGIDRSDLDVSGVGESQPVAPNALPDGTDNPDGRAQNRRVEVIIEGVAPRTTDLLTATTSAADLLLLHGHQLLQQFPQPTGLEVGHHPARGLLAPFPFHPTGQQLGGVGQGAFLHRGEPTAWLCQLTVPGIDTGLW